MTPIEIKALRLLKDNGRMKATQFAEQMGWPGKSPQGAGYLARLAKKGLVDIHHTDARQPMDCGYYGQISTTGVLALMSAGPGSRWGDTP